VAKNGAMKRSEELRAGVTPLGSSFAWRVRDISRLFERSILEQLGTFGITYGEWRCLRVLWVEDGITQKVLGTRLDMTSASTVFSVNLLERDGLAKRIADRSDKRRVFVRLTKRGRALEAQLLPILGHLNHRIVAGFSDADVLALSDLLDRLKDGLESELAQQEQAV
jgi:DNA-binding MarR family transcriptional regulator